MLKDTITDSEKTITSKLKVYYGSTKQLNTISENRGHDELPTQTRHFFYPGNPSKSPLICIKFDTPKMGPIKKKNDRKNFTKKQTNPDQQDNIHPSVHPGVTRFRLVRLHHMASPLFPILHLYHHPGTEKDAVVVFSV